KNNKEIDLRNKIVSIELTHRCNLNCKHCCISAAFTDDKSIDLSTTKVKEMLDKLIEWNPERISVSGGEP
ncbi:4Fe-4S cluster-binding domain-containing protein, partial [Acinetobacter soli]|uniref:radical SAM protein n=1 Tax=Acinetobacter soli TaxID=487316 RepID=UPI00281372FD